MRHLHLFAKNSNQVHLCHIGNSQLTTHTRIHPYFLNMSLFSHVSTVLIVSTIGPACKVYPNWRYQYYIPANCHRNITSKVLVVFTVWPYGRKVSTRFHGKKERNCLQNNCWQSTFTPQSTSNDLYKISLLLKDIHGLKIIQTASVPYRHFSVCLGTPLHHQSRNDEITMYPENKFLKGEIF